MEFYTNSIAQRTRLRRMKFEGDGSKRRKRQQSGLNEVKTKETEKNEGNGCSKSGLLASSSKCDPRKSVHGSKKCPDDVIELNKVNDSRHGSDEMTFNEDPRKGNRKPISWSKKYADLVGEPNLVVQFNRSPYDYGDSLSRSLSDTSDEGFDFVDFDEKKSRSFKNEGSDDDERESHSEVAKKEAVKTKRKRGNDLEDGETSGKYQKGGHVGSSTSHGKNIKEAEVLVVSSDDNLDQQQRSRHNLCKNSREEILNSSEEDWDEYIRKHEGGDETNEILICSDDESGDSAESLDSDYVVVAESPSMKNDMEELISGTESDDYEDKEESVEKQSLKKKEVSCRMKQDQMRRKGGNYSDESPKQNETTSRKKKGQMRRQKASYSDESLSERMKLDRVRNKRMTYSDELQDKSDFEHEATKKKKDKIKKSSREARSRERKSNDKNALKMKKILEREELISEESDDYEDEEESVEKQREIRRKGGSDSDSSLSRNEYFSRKKNVRRKRRGDSDKSLKSEKSSGRMKKGQVCEKRLTFPDESLKSKEKIGRMKMGQMKKKRQTYSDEMQENSDFEDEPTTKSKDKFKKSSHEVRSHKREKALKGKKVLGWTSHEQTVSSPQSVSEEASNGLDGMHQNTSFYDSDKEPISSVFKKKVNVRKPTYNARKDCSLQNGDSNEESEEETEKLIRKPTKRKRISGQQDYNEGGADTEEVKEPTMKRVSRENDDSEGGDETEQVEESTTKIVSEEKDENEGGNETEKAEEPTKRKHISRKKDDALGTLLKGLLQKEEPGEEEGLEENSEAKPPSPVEEPIPYKFRFNDDDEFPPKKEKDEFELMVEGLFDEMNYGLQTSEAGPSEPPKAESESEDENDQYARCRKGKHGELYFDEEIGLRCFICKDLILESKFVLGDLVDPPTRTSRRRDYYRDRENEIPWSYDHVLEASGNYSQKDFDLSKGTVWDMVPGIREEMYPHQQEGFEFLWKNLAGTIDLAELKKSDLSGGGGCIISHAPGTGKTRLTIVFLESFLKLFPDCRPVIIAPVSIILTWEEEFRKWEVKFPFHNLNNVSVPGRENISYNKDLLRVVKMTAWKKSGGVLGLSYSLFEKLAGEKFIKQKGRGKKTREKAEVDENLEMLRSILLEMPGLVVLDEGHVARNQTSSIWNALSNLKTEKCIILSGTPFQNNFGELFNTLSLVRPAIASKLSGEKAFDKHRENGGASNSRELDEAIEKLKAEIAPFVHVHKGSILQKSLPGLRDCVVILSPPLFQKGLIESMGNLQRQNTFEYEHKVAMVSVHPSLLLHCRNLSQKEKSCFDHMELENSRLDYERGVKTRFVIELIRLSKGLGEKVLIFSQYVQPLELIKDQLESVFNWRDGKQVLHIKGKLDQKVRQKIINDFNNPTSLAKVMLASTKCCSEGIHLVGASRVVLLDVVWNPSVERQAICRAYRIGQKKIVYTYHLMTSGTNEGEKYIRQAKKDRISELVFCASSPSSKTDEEGTEDDVVVQLDDQILEDMIGEASHKDMFKKIILQPKETNFLESFGSDTFS